MPHATIRSREEENTDCVLLRQTLELANASRMVVGHTIQPDLEVTAACNGQVIRIDVGMSVPSFVPYIVASLLSQRCGANSYQRSLCS